MPTPVQDRENNRPFALLDKINNVIGLLENGFLDVSKFPREKIGIPRDPANRLVVFSNDMPCPIRAPGLVMCSRSFQVFDYDGKRIDGLAVHEARTRRMSSSCEIVLMRPALKSARRCLNIRLCDSGTGIEVSSATESQRRSASSRRSFLGSFKSPGATAVVAMEEH
jgi:hypothetical protein